MIPTLPTSLKLAADDVKAGVSLGSVEMRARLNGKATGSIKLSELAGTVTAMPISIGPDGYLPSNTWQGWPKEYGNLRTGGIGTDVGDVSTSFYIGASRENIAADAAYECWLCGTVEPGNHWIEGKITPEYGNVEGSPWGLAIVCWSGGWGRGASQMVWYENRTDSVNYGDAVRIPDGYPYLTLICYQYVYGSPQPDRPDPAPANTSFYTTFENVRLRKQ